jgi:AcrR family transcriptional regulator
MRPADGGSNEPPDGAKDSDMTRKAASDSAREQRSAGETHPARAQELMDVALDLFSRRDYADVTIKDIANAVGVNTALIYYYFQNKEHLFQAMLRHAVERALDTYRRLQERHADPVALISAWFDTNIELFEPIRQLVKIMLDYSVLPTANRAVVDEVIRQFYDEELRLLSVNLRRGRALGLFKDVDPETTAKLVSTHLDGIMVRSMIHRDFDIPRAIEEFEALFWRHLGYEPASRSAAVRRKRSVRAGGLHGDAGRGTGGRARNGRQLPYSR